MFGIRLGRARRGLANLATRTNFRANLAKNVIPETKVSPEPQINVVTTPVGTHAAALENLPKSTVPDIKSPSKIKVFATQVGILMSDSDFSKAVCAKLPGTHRFIFIYLLHDQCFIFWHILEHPSITIYYAYVDHKGIWADLGPQG